MSESLPFSRVHIVGTGLLGTSIGLALVEAGAQVTLEDQSPSRAALAAEYGAGSVHTAVSREHDELAANVELVVVATPPDVTATVVSHALAKYPQAMVIDVASVKSSVVDAVMASASPDDSGARKRFLGTHPMAGRERGGPTSARVDLFTGRPWVITPVSDTPVELIGAVSALIRVLGATVHTMTPADHDHAVAVVSHLPQLVSSALATQLQSVSEDALSLAGQGLRDMTRIAAGDHELWAQILQHNAESVLPLLDHFRNSVDSLEKALHAASTEGTQRALAEALHAGASGVSRIPGKHGGQSRFATLVVVIDDRSGQLAALLSDVGALEVNLEDMSLEHSPGAPVGFVELSVSTEVVDRLAADLSARGWPIAGESQ
ncbi:prephenate dehydrogenase [Pontimonas salivibrio]|uniref:Prephenate dehydrogenase n=1 Tax=Pontimonas salivibrio TaxID=1159327 RepID=A0A2L2BR36_9MICO|nr:prephenate dehydrogenase [Pontimonas salivibrio]AVG24131.1 prephenate dehydrogenase [Pontimonas salivibrio]